MTPPPDAVRTAFGVEAPPRLLPGGRGQTWRAGDIILKPVDFAPETIWRAEVLSTLPTSLEFRVARPIRSRSGAWIVDGWEASEHLAGRTDSSRPDDVLVAGAAFHEAVAKLPRPEFLDLRDEPWSYGDRVAWEELVVDGSPAYRSLVEPLLIARRPVAVLPQVVHGDLAENVMFADGLPPAVIDWAVYCRPTGWASAVVVVDALCWYDARPELIERWRQVPEWGQMLIRALIYRMATDEAVGGAAMWTPEHRKVYAPVIELAIAAADQG
ncbi:TIGR02569 family protein [Kribbella sandramycini]|uniref:TIGR02569 family protein n=1 Tax=Kribbella sandramycini TaxID=60450 RepID=A0A7Y4KZF5_9ACTN|nr:uncharacterized protein (TIGR02569 family) [Kribbella sandramycini]NOL40752.1 TIGR02569 family protein [Kribbella sandramycini]